MDDGHGTVGSKSNECAGAGRRRAGFCVAGESGRGLCCHERPTGLYGGLQRLPARSDVGE